ncbi:MAG: TolC family protein [Verrucomicrobiae bacterium]|nr:TolC family protein [Verrucomicrobiae bacterium]
MKSILTLIAMIPLLGSGLLSHAQEAAKPSAPPVRATGLDSKKPTPLPLPKEGLDLQRCYELSLLRSESIGMSEQDIKVAQARYWQTVASVLPSFHAIGTENLNSKNYYQSGGSFGGAGGESFSRNSQTRTDSFDSKLNMKMPLFSGLRDLNIARAYKAQVEGNKQTYRRILQTLYLNVAESFCQLLVYERDMALLHEIQKTLADRVEDLEKRVRLGKSKQSELLKARTDLAQSKITIENTRGLIAASRELLSFYTGVPSEQLKIRNDLEGLPRIEQQLDYLGQVAERPDILAAIEAERAARAQLSAAKADHWPTIKLEANYELLEYPKRGDREWNAFVTIDVPIFEWGRIEAKVNENKALFIKSQLDLSELKRTATREVRTTFAQFNSSVAELARAREAAETALANYKAQVADYELGVVNNLDVLNALNQLYDIRRNLVSAEIDTHLNLIKLHVAAGEFNPVPPAKAPRP